MNIIICGAGQVGSHAAELLAADGHNVVVIDCNDAKLRQIEDRLDLQTLSGNCATAEILKIAGAMRADLVVAATNLDEINLLTASLAKGLGASQTVARVHHSTYFAQRDLDYENHLRIDRLICPEFATSLAIARTLRNPAALAIENFARGKIEMQEFPVSKGAPAINKPLAELHLPQGTRLATVQQQDKIFIPRADTAVQADDIVILVGNSDVFNDARMLFQSIKAGRRRIVIFGGTSTAVYLARALRDRRFSVRIFEEDLDRARELADKLDWVTVINASATDRSVFDEEHLDQANAFVALLDDDDRNILSCAWAKSLGVPEAIAVVQNPDYLPLLPSVGIDRPFSPRMEAGREIFRFIDKRPLHSIASLAEGIVDAYSVRVGAHSELTNRPLREVSLESQLMIAAIQRAEQVWVPTADDSLHVGDTLLIIGRHGDDQRLRKLFDAN